MENIEKIRKICRLVRYYILVSTTRAGSGHPSSSLSAVELICTLMFGGFFRFRIEEPEYPGNDRLIFSKGHAAPLLYAAWAAAGAVQEDELLNLRKFGSNLEGHPTPNFRYSEAATGSLGQGLSIGLGMALNSKYIDRIPYNTYVLIGDSEMTEGSQWEAMQVASFYRLDNLIGIIDVNRLGQRGETIYGRDTGSYEKMISSFGWNTVTINGHDIEEIYSAFSESVRVKDRPLMIIADTVKGKGVSFLEDKEGWHGRTVPEDQLKAALDELGPPDRDIKIEMAPPESVDTGIEHHVEIPHRLPAPGNAISTRKAYGNALVNIFRDYPGMAVLDAEVSNSTYSEIFKKAVPGRFFEMFIAEQNMVGAALGLSLRKKIPFVSTFAAFFSRAFDQIRMSQYSGANIKFAGSHAGVSIGPDGASQMGLEDIAMFRTLIGCVVLYPCDGTSTEAMVRLAAEHKGNVYIRTTRMETPLIYNEGENFIIGGSKTLSESSDDLITVCAAGITVHEALAARDELRVEKIRIRVIDLYSIKPVDAHALKKASRETKAIITVEDHFSEGGLGEAVKSEVNDCPVYIMAVRKLPRSGKPQELLDYEDISRGAIIRKVKEIIYKRR